MSADKNPAQHLTVAAAAQRMGRDPRWIMKLIAQGELDGFRHSARDVTVSIASLDAYLERRQMRLVRGPTILDFRSLSSPEPES